MENKTDKVLAFTRLHSMVAQDIQCSRILNKISSCSLGFPCGYWEMKQNSVLVSIFFFFKNLVHYQNTFTKATSFFLVKKLVILIKQIETYLLFCINYIFSTSARHCLWKAFFPNRYNLCYQNNFNLSNYKLNNNNNNNICTVHLYMQCILLRNGRIQK